MKNLCFFWNESNLVLGFLSTGLIAGCMRVKSPQSCPTLGNPMGCSPPNSSVHNSSVHGIILARILEWVAMPSARGASNPGIDSASLVSPALAGRFFTTGATWEAQRDCRCALPPSPTCPHCILDANGSSGGIWEESWGKTSEVWGLTSSSRQWASGKHWIVTEVTDSSGH